MVSLKNKYGSLALVAGASEGIGAAFSEFLASDGMDLILIARRKEPLEQLASQLGQKYKVKVECITCDLSDISASQTIENAIHQRDLDLVVYNAALSHIGPFESVSQDQNFKIACTNMITPMKLVQGLGESMLARGRGAVIIMASLAGFQGSGFLTAYAATKAFCRVLAEGLWYEWKSRGVDVIACCAGATRTPNFIKTDPGETSIFAPRVQLPHEVVRECMKALGKRPSIITGRGNRIASFIMQNLIPRKMAINLMGANTRKMYRL